MTTKKEKIKKESMPKTGAAKTVEPSLPARKFITTIGKAGKILGQVNNAGTSTRYTAFPFMASVPPQQGVKGSGKANAGSNPVRYYLPPSSAKKAPDNAFNPSAKAASSNVPHITIPVLVSKSPVAVEGPSTGLPNLRSESPILLLPFRLETRFVKTSGGVELWLRVYPDQISINTHKESLSENEVAAGANFWNQYWTLAQTTGSDIKGPWRTIAAKFSPQRAAWIVKQTYPSNWPTTLPTSGMAGLPAPMHSAPTCLTATGGNSQVSLSWTAPAYDGGSTITGYNIYRGDRSGSETFLTFVSSKSTLYTDTAVTNGQAYHYEVTAINSLGESSPSNEAETTPQATTPSQIPSSANDTTTAKLTCLPDRWTAFLYPISGPSLEFQFTKPVDQNLAVAPDLESEISISTAGAAVPDKMQWMINFDDAVNAGMAVRIPLTDPSMQEKGISRLVVLGLRNSSLDVDGASMIETLLDAHHYSDGMAFIPQGAPTKNTPAATSAYHRDDPNFEASYATELGNNLATANPKSGGAILATALGLDAAVFDHMQYADRTEQVNASAMLTALWPATLGYYLSQMMGIDSVTIEEARNFAIKHVFARGPFPAFRVGKVPYGILPTTSISLLMKSFRNFADPFARKMVPLVRRCLTIWQQSINSVPTVGTSGDPDGSLLEVLGMTADPVSYNFRSILGPQFIQNYLSFEGVPLSFLQIWNAAIAATGRQLLAQIGYPSADPFILSTGAMPSVSPISIASVFDGSPPISETEGLPTPYKDPNDSTKTTNYIGWLAGVDLDSVRNQNLSPIPKTLLYVLLRHSVLSLATRLATVAAINANITVNNQQVTAASARETELVDFPSQAPTQRPWDFLAVTIPGVTPAGKSYGQFLGDRSMIYLYPPQWTEMRDSLNLLTPLPTAELDRLLSETLATMGSRIDPWVTSLAHALLPIQKLPVHIGGYAWVENLTPNPAGSVLSEPQQTSTINELISGISKRRGGIALPTPTVFQAPPDNAGFIHAPSLAQGTTAAILRNGFASQVTSTAGSKSAPFIIDLSSHRVRSAMEILDGLRAGNSLTAILGYQFESMMLSVSSYDPTLTSQIAAFEDAYPLVANKLTLPPGPPSAVAAPNVVDGLALFGDYRANGSKYQNLVNQLPQASVQDLNAIMKELEDGLGALEDIFTAETIHQIQQGNTVRGGAILDSVENGNMPPEIQVLKTPRSSKVITHRLAVLFSGPPPARSGKPGDDNPRAAAEPSLHGWLRKLIPDPANVRCQYSIGPPDKTPGAPPLSYITLDKLGAGPLDLLAMVLADTNTPQQSELEARILDYIYNGSKTPPQSGSPPVTLVYSRDDTWDPSILSVPEYLVVLRAFADLLGGSRALVPADLSLPSTSRTISGVGVSGADVLACATNASAALQAAITSLQNASNNLWTNLQMPGSNTDPTTLQQSLRAVSWFNIPFSVPADPVQARHLVPVAAISVGSTVASAKTSATLTFSQGSAAILTPGVQITIWTTSGTVLSGNQADYAINGVPITSNPVTSANSVKLTVPAGVKPSKQVTVTMLNLTNPSTTGAITASVAASIKAYAAVNGDPMIAALASIAQADIISKTFDSGVPCLPSAVSNVTVAVTGAPLSLKIQFKTSGAGSLDGGAGTVSISGPGGTVFSSSKNDYGVQTSSSAGSTTLNAAPKVQGSLVTITVPFPIDDSETVTVLISNISGTLPSTAQFSVWTSSDPFPATSAAGIQISSIAGGSKITSATVNYDPVSATCTVIFQPSNALSAKIGTVTLWSPDGMSFSPHAEDYLLSSTFNPTTAALPTDPQVTQGQVTLSIPNDIAAGDTVTLVINGVQSPGAGSYALSIATSTDTAAVVAPFTINFGAVESVDTLKKIFGPSFVALPSFVPRNTKDLVAAFTASASLTKVDDNAIPRWVQQLTHIHPAVQRLDHAMGLAQVTSGSTPPSFLIGQLPVVPNDQWLGLPLRSSISPGAVKLDNPASNQTAKYTITFTTSPAGSLSGSNADYLVITGPAGTTLPGSGYTLQGLAAGSVSIAKVTLGTFGGSTTQNQATIVMGAKDNIPSGDLLTLTVNGVDNPALASDKYQFLIYTSSDPQSGATSPYSITGNTCADQVPEYGSGRIDLVVLPPTGFDPTTIPAAQLRGLWIDGWTENIPSPVETTGLTFHYGEPLTQAPQVLLLAANPTKNDSWTDEGGLATLRTIVEETLEMAKIRAVDDLIRTDGGEFLPATYCAFNPLGDTPSIDFKLIQPWYGAESAKVGRVSSQ